MGTYLLIGNPEAAEGMSRDEYEADIEKTARGEFADEWWSMTKRSKSRPGDQVVLLRTGSVKRGIIGFGVRRAGEPKPGQGTRFEFPVKFANLRSLRDEPFLDQQTLRHYGFSTPAKLPFSGRLLEGDLLEALERCCAGVLCESASWNDPLSVRGHCLLGLISLDCTRTRGSIRRR